MRRGSKQLLWDVAGFARKVGGIVGASWMVAEAAFNVNSLPGHWRVYVGVLSLMLIYYLLVPLKPPENK